MSSQNAVGKKPGKALGKILKKWNSIPGLAKIAGGLVIGILLGFTVKTLDWVAFLGELFVGTLKVIAPIIVFLLTSGSVANAKPNVGKRCRSVIILYMLTTLTSAVVAVIASFLFPVTIVLRGTTESSAPGSLLEIFKNLLLNTLSNPVQAIIDGNFLCVLFWGLLFGLCLKAVAGKETKLVISDVADAVSKSVSYIVSFAPLGILGLVYDAVRSNGSEIFTVYGKIILVLVGSMLFAALIVNPAVVFLSLRRNPYPLVFTCIRESAVTAFFTRSSAANIPINMKLCDRLGIDKDFYSISIPLGATINMDGAAITITVMTMATCHTLGIEVNLITAILLSFLSVLGACGSSGVAGGSLLLIPMACGAFGISPDVAMQAVAVGFVIGVIQDSFETAFNSSADVIFTATAEYRSRIKNHMELDYLGEFSKNEDYRSLSEEDEGPIDDDF